MKIKITKTDLVEEGGKLFLKYLEDISKWECNKENLSLFDSRGYLKRKSPTKSKKKKESNES